MLEGFNADWGGGWIWNPSRGSDFSPSETMLAVTVKKDHHEETRCVLVHLGGLILCQKALLVLHNVFSFGKIYYNWNFFWQRNILFLLKCLLSVHNGPQMTSSSTAHRRTLRCLRVFRLHLSDSGVQNTLVYEEKDPEYVSNCWWRVLLVRIDVSLLPIPQVLCGGQLFQRPEAGDH